MATNYDKMADGAAGLFLRFDQEEMIRKWSLNADERYLYVPFFSDENTLKIERASGCISRLADGVQTAVSGKTESSPKNGRGMTAVNSAFAWEGMVLYDLLTYSRERPQAAGVWASIPELGGVIGAGHDHTLKSPLACAFTGKASILHEICVRLGGRRMEKGDVSFAFRVFRDFWIWMQFWDADEDFPASVSYFFDRNALQFMHYETLWYVMNILERRILAMSSKETLLSV